MQIIPESGKFAVDSKENNNVMPCGDTNVYGDINTRSFNAFFRPVMHCSSKAYCNDLIGPSQKKGFVFGQKAGG
ncbi:MAG: hypothetical protein IKP65_02285 [Alphaproteobacteria bacterium]|nr:hypothetical protein [Alphaproteobacteria bacterium]